MRAKTVNENYPPGAANDPRAPWNEPEDDSVYDFEVVDDEILVTRKYNFSGGMDWEDWDEDEGYIDPEDFDMFAAKKLGIDAEEKWESEDYLEIQNVENVEGKKDTFLFKTSWGGFEVNMDELIDLSNLF